MVQIITKSQEIAKCQNCQTSDFQLVSHPELPSQMAFCVKCEEGKDVSQYQLGYNVGTISRAEFEIKYADK